MTLKYENYCEENQIKKLYGITVATHCLRSFAEWLRGEQAPCEFWYRVDYVGDNPIAKEAGVGVVVKESMTDGTVVQDMDLSGNMLSQPLSAYPPLLREAIGHLRNRGTPTMVIPPSLAYGAAGYQPNVPPNATMVYTLRIEKIEAAPDKYNF